MSQHLISDQLTLADVRAVVENGTKVSLSPDAQQRIEHCHAYLLNKMEAHDAPIYGINTGFGALHDKSIAKDDLAKLQRNLVVSHACGMGDEVPAQIVRTMLLLKVQGLSYGHSGVALATVQRLVDMLNNDVLPIIHQQGSLGASGDLAPLAHLALPLIGEGKVRHNGELKTAASVLKKLGWMPLELGPKEGLALLNGTQFMSAYTSICLLKMERLTDLADKVAALSIDAFDGRMEPFTPEVHDVRPHGGQAQVAANIRELLTGSAIATQHKKHVQDPYSFRCVPQVHGASRDSIAHVLHVVNVEINSVTDNPTIFPDQDMIVSAGNFHGQPLALVLDQLAVAAAELGSISERRTYKLISGQRGLPEFLVADPGLNSGFMIPQYTAASIVSQNKQLCTPSSVDTIDSSNGQEDHVSMGANGATRTYRVVENLERILAIELLNAAQALEFRRPLKSSDKIEALVADYRSSVPFMEADELLHDLMGQSLEFVRNIPND